MKPATCDVKDECFPKNVFSSFSHLFVFKFIFMIYIDDKVYPMNIGTKFWSMCMLSSSRGQCMYTCSCCRIKLKVTTIKEEQCYLYHFHLKSNLFCLFLL